MSSASRTFPRIIIAAVAALALLIAVLLLTPLGLDVAVRYGGSALADATGLGLSAESRSGSLAAGATLEGVALTAADGRVLFRADTLAVRASLTELLGRRVEIERLRVTGGELTLEIGPDGVPLGLELSRRDTSARPAQESRWTFGVDARLMDWRVSYRDTARGLDAVVDDLDLIVAGGLGAYEGRLACAASLEADGLARTASVKLSAHVSGNPERVSLESMNIAGEGVDLAARGWFEPAPNDSPGAARFQAAADGSVDVHAMAAVFGTEVEGAVSLSAEAGGRMNEPRYEVNLSGEGLSHNGIAVPSLEAGVRGRAARVDLERLTAAFMGGVVTASGEVDLAGLRGEPGAAEGDPATGSGSAATAGAWSVPPLELSLKGSGLDLAEVGMLTGGVVAASGLVDLELAADVPGGIDSGGSLSGASATLELTSSGAVVDTFALGPVSLSAYLREGTVSARGSCCGATFVAGGTATPSGTDDLSLEVDIPDVSATGSAFGVDGAGGSLHASARLIGEGGSRSVSVDAESPDLTFRGFRIGVATVHARAHGGSVEGRVSAFDGAATAEGTLREDGRYTADIAFSGFDVASVVRDSLPRVGRLSGSMAADLSLNGSTDGSFRAAGSVSDLSLSASGSSLTLSEPFSFTVRPDSFRLTPASMSGDVGSFSIGGAVDMRGDLSLEADLETLDIAAVASLLLGGGARGFGGTVSGRAELAGSHDDPRLALDVSARDLVAQTVRIDSLVLVARAESGDLVGEFTASSPAGGTVTSSFYVPIVRDSVTLLRADVEREFSCSADFNDLAFEAGPLFLPQLGGGKRAEIAGSASVSGFVGDSESLIGEGRFDRLAVELDLVGARLLSPVAVRLDRGDVSIDELVLGIERRRTLGEESGGTLRASGSLHRDGTVAVLGRCERLDVGQLLKAVGRQGVSPFEGRLDALVAARGSVKSPAVEFDVSVTEPVVVGFGLDEIRASGRMDGEVLHLEDAFAAVRGETIEASGTVSFGPTGELEGGSEGDVSLDLRVKADAFALKRMRQLPRGVERLDGLLSMDARVTGPASAPEMAGQISLHKGRLGLVALEDDIQDIEVTVRASESVFTLAGASARLGRGSIDASGFLNVDPSDPGSFWLTVNIRGAELKARDFANGRVSGSLVWGGVRSSSRVSGAIEIEKGEINYQIGLAELMSRRAKRLQIVRLDDPRAGVALDVDVNISDRVFVRNNLADLDLQGGLHVGGTALRPVLGGGVYADGGSVTYLKSEFELEALTVSYMDPRRQDPYISLVGLAEVESRDGETYYVTIKFEGFLYDGVPVLTSTPALNEADIVALLTFGDTVGGLVYGSSRSASSGESFSGLARKAFLGGVTGVASKTMGRLLHLDTLELQESKEASEDAGDMSLTVGKGIGDRLQVNYTTALGRFADQSVEISFKLAERVFLDTRSGQDGNHAIDIRLRLPFK